VVTEGSSEGSSGRLRIGNVERNAAMKALDAHLEAGRLGVEEYGERSAAAAGAIAASELEALFTDLLDPHPALPGSTPAPVAVHLVAGATSAARWDTGSASASMASERRRRSGSETLV
jgi:hypothetical protein